jgi:hypothetical protein
MNGWMIFQTEYFLISPSSTVEIPRLRAQRRFVMPVKTGIQVRLRTMFKERLDSASAGMTGIVSVKIQKLLGRSIGVLTRSSKRKGDE